MTMTRWTEDDIPDQSERTVLITGANSGIGFEAARAMAQHGATVVMGCRNKERAADALSSIEATNPTGPVEVLEMDLSDLASVRDAASSFVAKHDRLDILVNNAGLMATPRQRTADGFEMQFGVNHLGHFALTGHLIDVLTESGPSRIVSVSSLGHRLGKMKFDDLNADQSYSPWPAYFQSKLANLLFTRELQRRLSQTERDIIAVAAHPGVSRTNLGSESPGGVLSKLMAVTRPMFERLGAQSAQMGALPTLRAAVDPSANGGDYYGPNGFGEQRGNPKKVDMSSRAKSDSDARKLWDISEQLTAVTYLDQ